MDPDRPLDLSSTWENLNASWGDAIAEMNSLTHGEERSRHLRNLATLLVGLPKEAKAAAVLLCPELATAEPFPETLLCAKEMELVSHLTSFDVKALDNALLENSGVTWRKVSRVIGSAMVALEAQLRRAPLGFYVQRIGALVEEGALLARGNVEFMRLCEVRLPAASESEGQVALFTC